MVSGGWQYPEVMVIQTRYPLAGCNRVACSPKYTFERVWFWVNVLNPGHLNACRMVSRIACNLHLCRVPALELCIWYLQLAWPIPVSHYNVVGYLAEVSKYQDVKTTHTGTKYRTSDRRCYVYIYQTRAFLRPLLIASLDLFSQMIILTEKY